MALHLKPDRFVAYYRVSIAQQGSSGLGLEAARVFVDGSAGALAEAFTGVESGKNDDRPQLAKALDACRPTGAVLVIAKLDRLCDTSCSDWKRPEWSSSPRYAKRQSADVRLMAVIAMKKGRLFQPGRKRRSPPPRPEARSWVVMGRI
jgi:Resolvase, N terminal domain